MASIPQWQSTATKLQDSVARLETELRLAQNSVRVLEGQVDIVRTESSPELLRQTGVIEARLAGLEKKVDENVARIDRQLDWTRDLWKTLALIVITSLVTTILTTVKDIWIRPSSSPPVAGPRP